jgi:hypothetical protein
MNWSRGLFRFWIIGAVLWAGIVIAFNWLYPPDRLHSSVRLKRACLYDVEVAATRTDDQIAEAVRASASVERSKPGCEDINPPKATTGWDQFPEVITQEQVRGAVETFHGEKARLLTVDLIAMTFMIVVPAGLVLGLGRAVLWAFAGFRRDDTPIT